MGLLFLSVTANSNYGMSSDIYMYLINNIHVQTAYKNNSTEAITV